MREMNRFYEVLESTNVTTKEWLDARLRSDSSGESNSLIEGTWVAAYKQNQGKGRQGRVWVSEDSGLYLSVIVGPLSPQRITWLPLLCGAEIIRSLQSRYSELELRLKWPNDLVHGAAKVGGLLCEAQMEPLSPEPRLWVVVGVGINVGRAPKLDRETASLASCVKEAPPVETLALWVRDALLRAACHYREGNVADFKKEFWRFSQLKPQDQIEWTNSRGHQGTLLDLDENGGLVVLESDQNKSILYSEEVHAVR
jgi:BirA family biotin operon repressor/biotin-[acetyl-CoA-carboxylase] ligase